MFTNDVIAILNTKNNGQFFKIQYATDAKLSAKGKNGNHRVIKVTTATARKGINYKNMKTVKARFEAKIASGEMTREEADNYKMELPWGQWKAGYEGLVIEHKGQDYIRLYTSPNKSKVTYYVDGVEKTKEEVMATGYVIPSYFNKKNSDRDCYVVTMESVQIIF